MGRLRENLLQRIEQFVDRVLNVAEELERQGRSRRLIDQVIGSATSVGANTFESDEATTAREFVRCLAIASRELSETRFWLRLFSRRQWIADERLSPLLGEADELRRILGTVIHRTRTKLNEKSK